MGNKQNWLHTKLQAVMGPALIVLIGSSIFRGLLGLIIASLSKSVGLYENWDVRFRLVIEIVVFLGVFVSSDVCFAATVTNCEQEKKRINNLISEDMPKQRGTAEQVQASAGAWQKQHDLQIEAARGELKTEKQARLVFGFVSISYAMNFVIQSTGLIDAKAENVLIILIDSMSIAIGVFVIWYYGARYKAEKPDPQEKSEGLIMTAVDKRLDLVSDHFKAGAPTDEDLNLADAGLEKRHHYKRFVAALRKPPQGDEWLTTNDIYEALHLPDMEDIKEIQAAERRVRRIISVAFDKHVEGVRKDESTGRTIWYVNGKTYYQLFKSFTKAGQGTDRARTATGRQRPKRYPVAGQQPDDDQNVSGSPTPAAVAENPPAATPDPVEATPEPSEVAPVPTYTAPVPTGMMPASV